MRYASVVNYRVRGGKPLSGTIETNTSKNAAVALLAASMLNRGVTTLMRMPRIEEVNRLIEVMRSIGVEILWEGNTMRITPPAKLRMREVDATAAGRTRSIALFAGALAHREQEFLIPVAGGCHLGNRSLTAHIDGLHTLGIEMEGTEEGWMVRSHARQPGEVVMYEASDTGVENILLAAATIPGITTIRFAPSNYMVQDLCVFLETLGVRIEGIGTSTLVVHGVAEINKEVRGEPSEDPIESMFFFALAATTKSQLTIKRCPIDFLELELQHLKKMRLTIERGPVYVGNNGRVRLCDVTLFPSTLYAAPEKIAPLPYPGINIDNLPFFVPVATQAVGRTLVHDWVYENRAIYYTEMNKLGADVVLADPHRVFVNGPTKLHAAEVDAPPALRPATLLLIGMLAAEGESLLKNVYPINRGYENLHERLKTLGADVEAVETRGE